MRVMVSTLAVLGCSVLPVSAVIRSPIDSRCQSLNLKGCPEIVDGAIAYAEGNEALARKKLHASRLKNSPEQLQALANALRDIAGSGPLAQPLEEVAELLTGQAPTEAVTAAPPAPTQASPTPAAEVARPSTVEDRRANAQRLAIYALAAREDLARRVSETVELADAPGTSCQIAGSEAICLRRQKGPFVVTDVIASEECGQRVFVAVSDTDKAIPMFGFAWLLPARAPGIHGGSFALRGGQWLYIAVKAAKPTPGDRGCFVTWSGFQPRLVPSLVSDDEDYTLSPYRLRD